MPVKFEWQTDKEQEWKNETAPIDQTPFLQRHWRYWIALFLLIFIVIGISFAMLNRRANTTENILTDDVLASHQLVQQAIANRDSELFALMLFPYDRDWGELQRQLFDRQMVWDRVPLGLWAAPHLAVSEPAVTMAPDLETAVVTTHMPTIIEVGGTVTETIVLEHTAVYQRDDSQWLLAPLPESESFWGQTITEKGVVLTLIYPERDAEIGRRLIVDLDKALEELCQLESVSCSPSFRLRLSLETDYNQLLALGNSYQNINPRRVSGGELGLTLPAPTLVGRPVDEAGYQAVMRGYSGWTAAILVNEFNRVQQLDHAAIARQLAQIDLQPPPLNRERPWQPQPPSPIPLPEQDILVLCQGNNQPPQLWRYQLDNRAWIEETETLDETGFSAVNWALMMPLPDDKGVALLTDFFREVGAGSLILWLNGVPTLLDLDVPGLSWLPLSYLIPAVQPDRYLFFYEFNVETAEELTLHWLDLQKCPGSDCQMQHGEQIPYWSPDEERAILVSAVNVEIPSLALADNDGGQTAVIGPGWSPVWLDARTFAYVRPDPSLDLTDFANNEMGTELMISEVAATAVIPESIQVALSSQALRGALPEADRPAHLGILAALPNPAQPEQWFIMASTSFQGPEQRNYLFTFDQRSGEIFLVGAVDDGFGGAIQVQGNGRFLATLISQNGTPAYFVHDLERNRSTTYTAHQMAPVGLDWSADGEWFVAADAGMLRLIAPGPRFERPIYHEMNGCGTAVWVNSP